MNKTMKVITLIHFLTLVLLGYELSAMAASREVASLDFDWRFHRGDLPEVKSNRAEVDHAVSKTNPIHPAFDDSSWRRVDVPHDYIVEATFDSKADVLHASLPVEPAWYRKHMAIPITERGRRLWLEFDGVYRDSRMWFNGHYLGRHESGYTSFRYDVTEAAEPGAENVLSVRVEPTAFEGWWYEGGGIYRHTRLVSVAPIHLAPCGVYVVAAVPNPEDGLRADAVVTVTSRIENQSGTVTEATLLNKIVDATGGVLAQDRQTTSIRVGDYRELNQSLPMTQARLWSCSQPALYHLRSTVQQENQIVDEQTTAFGIRTFHFDAQRGFILNGKPVKIRGACNHQDFAGVGIALPDRIHEYRVRRLQEMGANAYRFSHHPMAPELLEVCDRLGMLVIDENRYLGDSPEILGQVESMVLADRNHPCVVLWSICNEEKEQGTELGAKQAKVMIEVIRKRDTTRPITAAMNGSFDRGLAEVVDVLGFNYHAPDFDWVHQRFPKKPAVATEMAAAVGTRGIYQRAAITNNNDRYEGDPQRLHLAAYGNNAPSWGQRIEPAWQAIAERTWIAGGFVWTGFDYRGEPTPFGWPAIGSQFGALDLCGFPKDAFYYYQAWWTEQPVLHLFPHWNWPGQEGREIDVWVYSNCPEVELFFNGVSLGKQPMVRYGHIEWKVPYQPGRITAKGRHEGQVITRQVETTGPAVALALEPDRNTITANGHDVSLVIVRAMDDAGRVVPVADDEVIFKVSGPGRLLGVGNGDPASHESDKASRRRVFDGLALAIVQASNLPGFITIQAEAPGLKSATARIDVR